MEVRATGSARSGYFRLSTVAGVQPAVHLGLRGTQPREPGRTLQIRFLHRPVAAPHADGTRKEYAIVWTRATGEALSSSRAGEGCEKLWGEDSA